MLSTNGQGTKKNISSSLAKKNPFNISYLCDCLPVDLGGEGHCVLRPVLQAVEASAVLVGGVWGRGAAGGRRGVEGLGGEVGHGGEGGGGGGEVVEAHGRGGGRGREGALGGGTRRDGSGVCLNGERNAEESTEYQIAEVNVTCPGRRIEDCCRLKLLP